MMKRSLIKKAVFAAIGAFCSITALANVAKIGGTVYDTLEEAFEAAKDMTAPITVTLLKDVGSEAENKVVEVPAEKEIVFDLNEKTIYGRVQIKDHGEANLTIRNGNILNTTGSNAVWLKKGSISLISLNMESNYHGFRVEGGDGYVNGGDYRLTKEGGYNLMYAKGGRLIIEGGDFVDMNSAKSSTMVLSVQAGAVCEISGGTFTGTRWGTLNNKEPVENIFVSGGRFDGKSYLTLVIGYQFESKDSDGYYPVVKANYALTVNAENAEVSELNATYQYEDEVSFTVTPTTGYKVTSVKLGADELTADANGKYTFFMPAKAATITVTTEATSTFDVMIGGTSYANADALKEEAKAGAEMTVPETSTWTAEGNVLKKDGEAYVEFADYYTVVVNGTMVTLKLNKPVIGDSQEGADDAFTVTTDAVTIKITNYNSALKYGVRFATDISGLSAAEIAPVTPTAGVITLEKAAGNSAFYEVVVSDVNFPVAE